MSVAEPQKQSGLKSKINVNRKRENAIKANGNISLENDCIEQKQRWKIIIINEKIGTKHQPASNE